MVRRPHPGLGWLFTSSTYRSIGVVQKRLAELLRGMAVVTDFEEKSRFCRPPMMMTKQKTDGGFYGLSSTYVMVPAI